MDAGKKERKKGIEKGMKEGIKSHAVIEMKEREVKKTDERCCKRKGKKSR